MEPSDYEVTDWEERGFSQEPLYVFVGEQIEGDLVEAGPGVVIDGSVDRAALWKEFMEPLNLEGWWWKRDQFIADGLDYFKYFQVTRENISPGALGDDGVPRLSRYSRRKIGGFYIDFWDSPAERRNGPKSVALVEQKWRPTVETPVPLVRCSKFTDDGLRCPKWAIRGGVVCAVHGGTLTAVRAKAEAVLEAARRELVGSVPQALETLVELTGKGNPEGVRLKAAESLLDRAGIKGGIEIDVNVAVSEDATGTLLDRLAAIAGRSADDDDDILDVEIVDELEETAE